MKKLKPEEKLYPDSFLLTKEDYDQLKGKKPSKRLYQTLNRTRLLLCIAIGSCIIGYIINSPSLSAQVIPHLIDMAKATFVGILSAVVFFRILLPRMTRDMTIATVEAIFEHPKIKKKLEDLTPLLEQAKKLDLQEVMDLVRGIKVFIQLQHTEDDEPIPPGTTPPGVGLKRCLTEDWKCPDE